VFLKASNKIELEQKINVKIVKKKQNKLNSLKLFQLRKN